MTTTRDYEKQPMDFQFKVTISSFKQVDPEKFQKALNQCLQELELDVFILEDLQDVVTGAGIDTELALATEPAIFLG